MVRPGLPICGLEVVVGGVPCSKHTDPEDASIGVPGDKPVCWLSYLSDKKLLRCGSTVSSVTAQTTVNDLKVESKEYEYLIQMSGPAEYQPGFGY